MELWNKASNKSNKDKLDTVTVWELMDNNFYIPDYQRGYRWTEFEVKKLMEDLSEYFSDDPEGKSFYCMQPLVVFYNEKKSSWEVIDGQQRLTTLFLMLSIYADYIKLKLQGSKLYKLFYESRPDSEKFLEEEIKGYISLLAERKSVDIKIETDKYGKNLLNIDYYHICNALKAISDFFLKNSSTIDTTDYIDNIINVKDKKRKPSVKFIWYDVTEEIKKRKISSEEIFARLNVGKIGLTNAELIKALFLNRVDKEVKEFNEEIKEHISLPLKTKIANDWDMIEHYLQDNDFWSFIYGKDDNKYDTRIEFLFDLIKKKTQYEKDIDYFTFDKYTEDFKTYDNQYNQYLDASDEQEKKELKEKMFDNSVEIKWKELTSKFYLYKNWYENKYLYHLIGYLRYKKIPIDEITDLQNNESVENNRDFICKLRKWCVALALGDELEEYNTKQCIEDSVSKLRNFNYGETPKNVIYDTLLLSNVLTALDCKKSNIRFSFNDFYETKWDLEHVRSQTPKTADGNDRTDWILTNLSYFSGIAFNFEMKHEDKSRAQRIEDFRKNIINELPNLENEIAIQAKDDKPAKTAKEVCEQLLKLLNSSEIITDTKIYKILSEQFINENSSPLKDIDNIHNLVLLDSGTNRSYKNAFFPVKRRWINAREKEGIYILPCTKNVFSKSYSIKLFDLMNWNNSDADVYIEEMIKCLSNI